jgi:hypothetical protein
MRGSPVMMSRFNGQVWGIDAKTACFKEWNPDMPRSYDNFNPFERNIDGAQCDTNGCYPGESRGYTPPNRPDASWAIMQEEAKLMDAIKKDPKYTITGRPGNYNMKWQEGLGAPP